MNKPKLNKLALIVDNKEYDISALFVNINVFEELRSNYITANITLIDSIGLLEQLKLQGDEQIYLNFNGSDLDLMEDHKKLYDIIAIKNVDNVEGTPQKVYTIELATQILNKSLENNLKISYKNKESSIVKSICNNILEVEVEVEDSLNNDIYIFKNEQPLDIFNKLTNFSQTKVGANSASYLFYEDNSGYKFKSIEKLISEESPYRTLNQKIKTNIKDLDFFSIKQFSINNLFDVENLSLGCGLGCSTYEIDLINKEVINKEYTGDSIFNNFNKIEKSATKIKNINIDKPNRAIIKTYTNDTIKNRFYQYATRNYVDSIFNNISVTCEMFGNTNLTVGKVIDADIKSNVINNKQSSDVVLSGKYLINAVRHEITKSVFNTYIEIIKPTMKGL